MANSTAYLEPVAYNGLEGKPVVAQKVHDFAVGNVSSGDSIDLLRIPKGAVVTMAGLVVHTTEASVTISLGDAASATQFLAAQTLTDLKASAAAADGAAIATDVSTAFQKFYAAEGVLRATVGGANATACKITVFCEYFVIAQNREVKS